jgi:hypothetical protein
MASTASGIRDFGLAVWSDWLTLLSGPLSVPAAALALWVSNDTAKIFFGLTAFGCLLFSAYRLWKREHDKVIERDQRKRQLLDDISDFRKTMIQYRIDMEADYPRSGSIKRCGSKSTMTWKIRLPQRLSDCLRKPKQPPTAISHAPRAQIAQAPSHCRS